MSAVPTSSASAPASRAARAWSGVSMPDSAMRRRPRGRRREQLDLASAIDLERGEVAGVDADDRRAEVERALQLGAGVHLDERLHLEILRGLDEVGREGVLDEREQDEDGVGAVHPRLGDLPDVDEEVLAQDRQVDDRAHGGEVGVGAAEVPRPR